MILSIRLFGYIILFIIFFITKSFSDNLEILGNKKVSVDTIKEIIDFDKNKNYNDSALLNSIQQKLNSTGFFKQILTSYSNNSLVIKIVENPLIDFFYLEGVINKSREDFIYNSLELASNRIYSENKLNKDIQTIKSIFLTDGYLNVTVDPVVSVGKNDLVNIVLKINRGDQFKINRIFFIGNKFFKSSTLSSVIQSSEHGWWKFLSSSTNFSSSRIDIDKRLLKKFYLDNGFYDVQIISVDVNTNNKNNTDIIFSINSGSRFYYNKIIVDDKQKNVSESDRIYLENYIKKKLSGVYSEKNVYKFKRFIEDFLINKKVEFVNTTFDIDKDKSNSEKLNIVFNLNSETKKFVNLINIKGNSITEEKVIRDNLIFSEGDSYATHKIVRSVDNLKSLGIFKSVNYKPINSKDDKLVDFEINVEEQPTGQISAGIGIGSSGSAISSGLEEKNLFGKGISFVGTASFGTEKIIGSLRMKFPKYGLNENDLSLGFSAQEIEYDKGSYKSKILGTDISQSYLIYEDIFFNVGFGIDNDKISTTGSSSSYIQSLDGNYNTYKVFYGITNDKRNRKFQTTDGYIVNFNQKIGVPGSDIQYFNNNISASYYYPINEDYIFNLKSGFSSINGMGGKNIKLSDRLFLSNKKLRGFENRALGPKDNNSYIGGNYSSYLGFSSSFPNPLPDKWNATTSIFLDSGNVWGVDYDSSKDISKLRSATGVSLDWISPLGPLSFVFSQTLSSASSDSEQNFSFQLGTTF